MKATLTCNWPLMQVLRFTLKTLEKLRFQKIIPEFLDRNFGNFFWKAPKNDDRNELLSIWLEYLFGFPRAQE